MKIAVIGDSVLDLRRSGTSSRVSPEDPSCLVLTNPERKTDLGGASNLAKWLASCEELEVHLFSHYVRDAAGLELEKLCKEANVNLNVHLQRFGWGYCTPVKERICLQEESHLRQLARCDQEHLTELTRYESIFMEDVLKHEGFASIVVADYDKGMFRGPYGNRLREAIGSLKLPVTIVNSKRPKAWSTYPVDFLVCNRKEAREIYPETANEIDIKRVAAQCLVVTRSEAGVSAHTNKWEQFVPTLARDVLDVTGAGDSFTAGFAACYLTGDDAGAVTKIRRCLNQGQEWAAWCCQQIGCGAPPPSQAQPLEYPDSRMRETAVA